MRPQRDTMDKKERTPEREESDLSKNTDTYSPTPQEGTHGPDSRGTNQTSEG